MKQFITIEAFCVPMVIGVYDWERVITQTVQMDIKIACDMQKACLSDDISDAINYKKVCDEITTLCQKLRPNLLEHLAWQIVVFLFANYPCDSVALHIKKPHAIKNATVGVGLELTKDEFLALND